MTDIRQGALRRETLLSVTADAKINGLFRETLRSSSGADLQIKAGPIYREALLGMSLPSSDSGRRRMSLM